MSMEHSVSKIKKLEMQVTKTILYVVQRFLSRLSNPMLCMRLNVLHTCKVDSLTERSEMHSCCEIVAGDNFWAILSHTILHLKSTEYGSGIAFASESEFKISGYFCACMDGGGGGTNNGDAVGQPT